MKSIFLPADKLQRFFEIDTIILDKFAISVQYLKKEMNDEVNFLHADKYERKR